MDLRNLLIGILLMALAFAGVKSCSSEKAYNETVAAKEAQLIKWRDKYTGAETAKRQVIETTKKDLQNMKAGAYQDSLIIKELQRQVKKAPRNTKAVTVVSRSISGTVKASGVVRSQDTTTTQYTNQDSSFTATVTETPDSSYLNYQVKDTLVFTQYEERQKFLGPLVPFVQVENKNSAVTITGLRTYQVRTRKRYTGLKVLGGVLFGAGTIVYLKRR